LANPRALVRQLRRCAFGFNPPNPPTKHQEDQGQSIAGIFITGEGRLGFWGASPFS